MTHSFRFSEKMETLLKEDKIILSKISDIPVEELTDTMVIHAVLSLYREVFKDYLN